MSGEPGEIRTQVDAMAGANNPAAVRSASSHPATAKEAMIREIASWPGVSVHEHRFGGVEFRVGRRELGHLHASIADLPFPRRVRDELVAQGRARPHHFLPDSGWVTVPMQTATEIANVTELFRQNYDRPVRARVKS